MIQMIQKRLRTTKTKGARRRRSYKRRQRGGAVAHYNIYIFTKTPITEDEKRQLRDTLVSLYGEDVAEFTDFEHNSTQQRHLEGILGFVYEKGRYPLLENVTTFTIPLPGDMRGVDMTDPLLTKHEMLIKKALKDRSIPFKLMEWAPTGFGAWDKTYALIPLERKPMEF